MVSLYFPRMFARTLRKVLKPLPGRPKTSSISPAPMVPEKTVHETRDNGLNLHRQLFQEFCAIESKGLMEWDGDHRVPLKSEDVPLAAGQINELAKQTRVYRSCIVDHLF